MHSNQNMINIICVAALVVSALAAPRAGYDPFEVAKPCDDRYCKLPTCLCTSNQPPLDLSPSEIPQLVLLTFDDAVNIQNINYYDEAFNGRYNPDGCPVGSTYFVSHDYSDYSILHDLWARGHEIALHSITHKTPIDVWKNMTVEEHKLEFADQASLINHFADIPINDIQGIRIPFLQLSGDSSFEMIEQTGDLQYDCTWPTQDNIDSGFWPYTLDYKTEQDCPLPPCPTSRIVGVWVVPMVDWRDLEGTPCAMVDSCRVIPKDEDELVEFMIQNFNRHYKGTRSPFGFYVHAAWFGASPIHFPAYLKFLDYLQGLNDVYLVSVQRALQWVQNPSTLDNLHHSWPSCQRLSPNTCTKKQCQLRKGEDEERWMTHCQNNCPDVYPWLGNPFGKAQKDDH